MVKDWSDRIESLISKNQTENIENFIKKSIEGSSPDIQRDYKIKKLFEK